MDARNLVDVWVDGGCIGNPGPGAWAFIIGSPSGQMERSGYEASTTNNRMELTAVREALREITAHPEWKASAITVSTDSQYVQKGITDWIHAWVRNSWKTSAKKPVKNVDLWMELWELSRSLPIRWTWVMGHAGDRMNEACHRLVENTVERGGKRGE